MLDSALDVCLRSKFYLFSDISSILNSPPFRFSSQCINLSIDSYLHILSHLLQVYVLRLLQRVRLVHLLSPILLQLQSLLPLHWKCSADVVPNPSFPSGTKAIVVNMAASSDEQANETNKQADNEGLQEQRLSSFTKVEKNLIKEDLSHLFDAAERKGPRATC